jgi:SAM-dependent methyltransferase
MKNQINHTWKGFWQNAEVLPSSKQDTQIEHLINVLKRELEIEKITTILEVGVGYGRVAEALLSHYYMNNLYPPAYIGLDISTQTLERSRQYLANKFPQLTYITYIGDFETETLGLKREFDLVISVETMSVVPYDTKFWIDKMISLSNKYVVNLDFRNSNDTFTNCPPHPYELYYKSNSRVDKLNRFGIPNRVAEEIFVANLLKV